MADYFPAFLDLRGRRCLVVGGGAVAERKTRDLLACGASVVVVSPAVTPGLAELARAQLISHRVRRFRRWDTRGCAVVIAATGDPAVDAAVAVEARRRHGLVNVVDDPARCDFIVPSVLRRGQLQVAVSTGGRSPALARDIRRRLEPLFPAELGTVIEEAGRRRSRARAAAPTAEARLTAGERVAASTLIALSSL